VANKKPNIVLTGFMASGKSSVGRILASKRSLAFIDTDDLIVERHGSIEKIFATQGEDTFREMERTVARDLEGKEGLVIATGGRMMLDQYCADTLSLNGHVFCLSASIEEIQRRYAADDGEVVRPLLVDADETKLRRLYEERVTAYDRFQQVETEGRSIDEVVEQIELLLRNT